MVWNAILLNGISPSENYDNIFVKAVGVSKVQDIGVQAEDSWILVLFGLLLFIGIIGFLLSRKRKRKESDYGATSSYSGIHMHGIPHVPKGSFADIFLTEEKMIVECNKHKFELKFDQITAAEGIRKSDLLKKDKSVIGRGIVGGLILGPLGAVVGGMSGIGEKNKKGDYLVINYRSRSDEEINVIIFDLKNILNAQKIAKQLTSKILAEKQNSGGAIEL